MLNWLKERIRLFWIKYLIAIHYRNQILGLGEVDDVVGIARQHVDSLNLIPKDLELYDLVGAQLALLDQPMAGDYNEELPLGVVPVLAFGDARLGDVDAHLAAPKGVDQLGKGAAVVHIHLEGEGDFLLGQVAEVGAVEFLGKATGRDFGN